MNMGEQRKLYSITNNRIAAKKAIVIANMRPPKRDCSHTHKLFEEVLFK